MDGGFWFDNVSYPLVLILHTVQKLNWDSCQFQVGGLYGQCAWSKWRGELKRQGPVNWLPFGEAFNLSNFIIDFFFLQRALLKYYTQNLVVDCFGFPTGYCHWCWNIWWFTWYSFCIVCTQGFASHWEIRKTKTTSWGQLTIFTKFERGICLYKSWFSLYLICKGTSSL